MSWQKCESAEFSLAVPTLMTAALHGLHAWVVLSVFWLELPPEITVLLLALVLRSWILTCAYVKSSKNRALVVARDGRFQVNECSRRSDVNRYLEPDQMGNSAEAKNRKTFVNHEAESVVTKRQYEEDAAMSQQYTCCRSVRVPGCILLELTDGSAKPLEILVFYRYHQRQFYRRLLRQLILQ